MKRFVWLTWRPGTPWYPSEFPSGFPKSVPTAGGRGASRAPPGSFGHFRPAGNAADPPDPRGVTAHRGVAHGGVMAAASWGEPSGKP